jgi:hypothetical protein
VIVRDRSTLGQDAEKFFCVVNVQGEVALAGVEARLAVREGFDQIAQMPPSCSE